MKLGQIRKAVTALALTLTGAVGAGLIVGRTALWIGVVTAALSTAGVWSAPNDAPDEA